MSSKGAGGGVGVGSGLGISATAVHGLRGGGGTPTGVGGLAGRLIWPLEVFGRSCIHSWAASAAIEHHLHSLQFYDACNLARPCCRTYTVSLIV